MISQGASTYHPFGKPLTKETNMNLAIDSRGGLLAEGLERQLRPDVPIHVAGAELEFWASGSVSCGSWRRRASHLWPLTCRSRPSAG